MRRPATRDIVRRIYQSRAQTRKDAVGWFHALDDVTYALEATLFPRLSVPAKENCQPGAVDVERSSNMSESAPVAAPLGRF